MGVDGSPGARAALAWALTAAAGSGANLELVSSYPADSYWMDPFLLDVGRLDAIRDDTTARVREFLAEVLRDPTVTAVPGAAEVPTDVVVAGGAPAEHLVARAGGAQLLVVGSRGRGGVRSTLLGSVALHCVAHAPCPVVVVHAGAVQPPPRVVVGIDDSAMSRTALARAADEARRRGAELEVVAVHQVESYWSDLYAVTFPPVTDTLDSARARVEEIVTEVLGSATGVRLRIESGAPAEELVRAADGAVLLVVGSRSHSRIAGMVLGSVALHCAVHAACPVMVVHPEPTGTASGSAARSAQEPAQASAGS
ncbi:universal stress protein [Blastococcus sp. URHD0036]|uniref:universal stress protein n=1 Tax=Blastococcus sp. URHD0036 TaxID=1380356 RepID=UPI000AAD4C42|nr:universal stress protein [Blastococcus sp. URHD0036]